MGSLIQTKLILLEIMECEPLFLDCQGEYDLIGQIINLILTAILIYKAFLNTYRLKKQSSELDQQLQVNPNQKLRINFMCGIFLISLAIEIIFSISSYGIFYSNQSEGLVGDSKKTVSILYKAIEILVVNSLNCLIVMVGSLYWRAVREYELARNPELQNEHQTGILRFYKKSFEKIFNWLYIFNFACVVASAVLLSFGGGSDKNQDYTAENIINFIAIIASITVFLFTKFIWLKVMLNNSQISPSQLSKQYRNIFFIVLTCIFRIIIYGFGIFDLEVSQFLRKYDDNCFDTMPFNAIWIVSLTTLVNLWPPFIFTRHFGAAPLEQPSESLRRTLTEEEYNNSQVQPSDNTRSNANSSNQI